MNGRTQGCRARWLPAGLAVAALIALYAPGGGSAQAGTIGTEPVETQRIATAPDASAAPGIVLAGFSSQHYPTFFKLSPDGRTLNMGAIALDMHCTSGAEFVLHDAFARVRIKPDGRLHATLGFPPTAGPNGETMSGSDSLTARLASRHAELSGTWHLRLNFSFTNGMSDRCDSGPVRFSATG